MLDHPILDADGRVTGDEVKIAYGTAFRRQFVRRGIEELQRNDALISGRAGQSARRLVRKLAVRTRLVATERRCHRSGPECGAERHRQLWWAASIDWDELKHETVG